MLRVRYHSPLRNFARTVLITGESGAARELAARAIHYGSASKNGPFVSASCASMPVVAICAELFGYEKSVTARSFRKIGRIEMAAGGTIFLDAIGNLPLDAQAVCSDSCRKARSSELAA